MSWREICKIQGVASYPKWIGSAEQKELVTAARHRIFGGLSLPGMSPDGVTQGIGKKNKNMLSKPDKTGLLNQLTWPFIRPEIMSGRTYREREKLQAKVQAGIKGIAAGQAEAEKEAKLKKKK